LQFADAIRVSACNFLCDKLLHLRFSAFDMNQPVPITASAINAVQSMVHAIRNSHACLSRRVKRPCRRHDRLQIHSDLDQFGLLMTPYRPVVAAGTGKVPHVDRSLL
jgi:hypothetical protein